MRVYCFFFLGLFLLLSCPLAAKPRTETVVNRPTTAAGGSFRPVTSVDVSRPKTTATVFKPTTSVQVFHPKTEVAVFHPTTTVEVVRPVTDPSVLHPGEKGEQAKLISTSSPSKPSAGGKKSAEENSVPASSSATSMSGYQPPKAKDFKAAQLGGGSAGLGNKTDESAKDAAAAAFQIPKGDAATLESILKGSNLNKADLTKAIQKKAGGK